MERHNRLPSPPTSSQLGVSHCPLCGGAAAPLTPHNQYGSNNVRKAHKRRKNCTGKCRLNAADEPHWSKLLQTGQVPTLSPPPVTSSPPVSPMAALGQSVSRFFKWITPSRRSYRKDSLEEDRPASVSSEDSGLAPESPVPRTISTVSGISNGQPAIKSAPLARPVAATPSAKGPTLLQTPSSSALLTKRYHEQLHRVQKPTPSVSLQLKNTGLQSQDNDKKLAQLDNGKLKSQLPGSTFNHLQSLTVTPQSIATCNGHLPLTVALSCPLSRTKRCHSETSKTHISDTWPPRNYHLTYDEDSEDVFESDTENQSMNERKNVQEFTIPHEDTHQDELVGFWKHGRIYRGRWHGDVMIQTYNADGERVGKEFWSEVKRMSKIRHENIALFMGACTTTNNLSLVTSVCNGTSLFERLHITREKMSLPVKIHLAYQVVQALAYLHAKRIVYRHMTSRNIFVEKQKATLSVINFSAVYKSRDNTVDQWRGQLPYLAPELLQSLTENDDQDCGISYTPQTDIYALGILLHELISATRPFRNIPRDALTLQISEGRRPPAERLACPKTLKMLMGNCWAHSPYHRPHTHEILKDLQKKDVTLHSRFSSSEPDNINKLKSYHLF